MHLLSFMSLKYLIFKTSLSELDELRALSSFCKFSQTSVCSGIIPNNCLDLLSFWQAMYQNVWNLNIGDMVIYEGKEVEHWREPFKEESECVQAMLHYQREKSPLLNAFDGRGRIALPERYSKYA